MLIQHIKRNKVITEAAKKFSRPLFKKSSDNRLLNCKLPVNFLAFPFDESVAVVNKLLNRDELLSFSLSTSQVQKTTFEQPQKIDPKLLPNPIFVIVNKKKKRLLLSFLFWSDVRRSLLHVTALKRPFSPRLED